MSEILSIVIPAYNEERTIHLILDKVKQVELIGGLQKEIIITNEDLVGRWWHSKNKAFDMQAPAEVNVIEVLAYLDQFSK